MMNSIFTYKQRLLLLTTAILLTPSQVYAIDTQTTPSGEVVVAGTATFNRPAAGQLNISQTSNRAVINWDRFDLGKNATTQFTQPSTSALAVNRVVGVKSDPTQILGALKSNGRLMVLDRNGVLFGKSAQVDVGGIIASTGNASDADVMDGNDQITLTEATEGTVENRGRISVADAGLAALVAPTVKNSGVINARFGRVSLASGSQATIDLFGDNLISLAVDSDLEHALIENKGDVLAEAGDVQITTRVARDIVDNSINISGLVDVSSIEQKAGKIILSGAQDATVKGNLLANSMAGGGDISIDAIDIGTGKNSHIDTNTTFTGIGGTVALNAKSSINSLGKVRANGEEGGGTVDIHAGDNVNTAGAIEARSTGASQGGIINVTSGGDETRIASSLNVNGIDAAGTIDVKAANALTFTNKSKLLARTLSTGPGGVINLEGNDIALNGQTNISGKEGGGTMEVNAAGNVEARGKITGIGEVIGKGASVTINAQNNVALHRWIDVSGVSGGGDISVNGNNVTATKTARLHAQGLITDLPEVTSNPGGTVTLNAVNDTEMAGIINVNGYNDGGGKVLLNGKNVDVSGTIQSDTINAGDGGEVRLAGTDSNTFSGRIYARGGQVSGDGGTVTFDQPNTIAPGSHVDVSAPNGNDGTFNH